jgi:lipoyl(octanoyl) transferase
VPLTSQTCSQLALQSLGLVPYLDALAGQRKIHAEVAAGDRPNTLILLEHPSVYTAGRRTTIEERPSDGTPVIDVDRGGKITYHGPGQLVGYPIIKLKNRNDVVGFVREIESALIAVCDEFGIHAQRYCERSGVWLRDSHGDRKIAAIGIRVARGTTMHGFALNVSPDLTAFDRIIPCGFNDSGVTSMAQELGRNISVDDVLPVVERHLFEALGRVSQ